MKKLFGLDFRWKEWREKYTKCGLEIFSLRGRAIGFNSFLFFLLSPQLIIKKKQTQTQTQNKSQD